jgi:hypothetical protein
LNGTRLLILNTVNTQPFLFFLTIKQIVITKRKNMKNKIYQLVSIFSFLFIFSCTIEPFESNTKAELITKDSALFQLISSVTTKVDDPLADIVCIDFIYPFEVLLYNSNREVMGKKLLTGDEEFSAFLGQLAMDQAISISYPIATTLADGTIFSINNNAELKLAIDSCSKEDIIAYCNSLFSKEAATCVWTVPFTENGDNKYSSGVFEPNQDGTLRFTFNDTVYLGTWTFLFLNDELHMNINLAGTSIVAQDWNIDRKIALDVDEIKLINSPKPIILRQKCETEIVYQVGSNGPSGGTVFYDKGSYSLGWRYIEAAPADLTAFEWGCFGSLVPNANQSQIGKGLFNSAAIANYHDNLNNYYVNPGICNILNNGSVVAKKALILNSSGKTDWFLPTIDELQLMYQNLQLQNAGSFTNSLYWSATQVDENKVKVIDFSHGSTIAIAKIPSGTTIVARAVRYF